MKLRHIIIGILSIIVILSVSCYFGYNTSMSEGFIDSSLYDTSSIKPLPANNIPDPYYFEILNKNGHSNGTEALIPFGYILDDDGQPVHMEPQDLIIATYITQNNNLKRTITNGTLDQGYFQIVDIYENPTPYEIPIPDGYKLDSNGQPIVMTKAEYENIVLSKNTNNKIIPSAGLETGYFIIMNPDGTDSNYEALIPNGFKINAKGHLLKQTKDEMYDDAADISNDIIDNVPQDPQYNYNLDNLNVEYHDDYITNNNDPTDASKGTWVKDKTGKLVFVLWSETDGDITYYQPGAYPYGASSYVPSYEDSIYLSKTSGEYSTSPVIDVASIAGGFCSKYANDTATLEQKCNATSANTCASTSCCVLVGGVKCAAGDTTGPTLKSNYGDLTILNKDFYYYQGKCYGNCVDSK